MCWKYINPHKTVFVWCDVFNSKPFSPHYLPIGTDADYDCLHYCPYCGKKLEVRTNDRRIQ